VWPQDLCSGLNPLILEAFAQEWRGIRLLASILQSRQKIEEPRL
jgi:hypothetical protein